MDTRKRYGLDKADAVLLFVQMFLIICFTASTIYLLVFVLINNLGGWMIASYILILLTFLSLILYATIGHKKGEIFYRLSILPFLGATLANVLLPGRVPLQMGLLTFLFGLESAFALSSSKKISTLLSYGMVIVSLTFSIYSSITARIDFLGEVSKNWPTYVAMYLSIFTPTIVSGTYALTNHIRIKKEKSIPKA